ncbi:polysaccharide deacetylase family protein [Winogradskyella tangerina]|uniref:polysaccharide deacetylase family protein n=1 Tax=Winogradskyella tangerina TaxID=2023240 RepID=UPI000DBE14CD|nr:polysaccharide deacetylase family protein [Winogradskyella tangerina]
MMKNLVLVLLFCLILSACQDTPSFINFTYPDGKLKALVLSYDDGTIQDVELAQLFDENGLKGTFNLNSSYLGVTRGWPQQNGDTIYQRYVPKDSLLIIYKNHEIAAHGALHKNFTDITHEEVLEEISIDIEVLSQLSKREIISMAYPFGNTNDSIAVLLSKTNLINGRTVSDTYNFELPDNYMMWHPTCHDSKALDYLNDYLELKPQALKLFYVWGHSWEFGDEQRWNNMVEFCQRIGKANDIWSVGNGELTQYLLAIDRVIIGENSISNPSDNLPVWIQLSIGNKLLEAGQSLEINSSMP